MILLHGVLPAWAILLGALPASVLLAWMHHPVAVPFVELGQRQAGVWLARSRAHAALHA